MSVAVAHAIFEQYLIMLGVHVGGPGTTHGPHAAHRNLDWTSPTVEHSFRVHMALTACVHPVRASSCAATSASVCGAGAAVVAAAMAAGTGSDGAGS